MTAGSGVSCKNAAPDAGRKRPARLQLSRAAGWRKPEGAVVVSRPSIWGNPWKPGRPARFWLPGYFVHDAICACAMDAADVVAVYRRLIEAGPDPVNAALPAHLSPEGRRKTRDLLRAHAARITANLPALRGRDLLCWCKPGEPCHVDVLLELANR